MENLYKSIENIEAYNNIIENEDAVLIYFSHEKCNVCKVLKPKIANFLQQNYPKMKMIYADTVKNPEIAGQNNIFAVPTIVAFIAGRESFRKSRNIGINELHNYIERPYNMLFSD